MMNATNSTAGGGTPPSSVDCIVSDGVVAIHSELPQLSLGGTVSSATDASAWERWWDDPQVPALITITVVMVLTAILAAIVMCLRERSHKRHYPTRVAVRNNMHTHTTSSSAHTP